jgi:glycosyltransferase involved in cell wall biosynthesis
MKVAYVMSRFPKLTETFVLEEMLAVRRRDVEVDIWPLLRERGDLVHLEAVSLAKEANYLPFFSLAILRSNVWMLRHRGRAWASALAAVVRGCWGSLNFLVGAIGIFPKVVHAARQMEEAAVTHVHCHFANHPAVAGLVIRRLTGIPFSFVAHGSDLHVDRHMLCAKLAEADFTVAVAEFNRQVMLQECPAADPEKVVVIHCGVDTSMFRPSHRSRSDGTLRIICVGTLHAVKGQAHLIDACAILRSQGHKITCRLVGGGPDHAELSALVQERQLSRVVELVGPRRRDDILRLLGEADVLVAPSVPTSGGKREGIPVVLMEAMSCGLAVVASDLSGIPELVEDGETGLLVPFGDALALSKALARLADEPVLRAKLGEAARLRILDSFDVDANARLLIDRFGGSPA